MALDTLYKERHQILLAIIDLQGEHELAGNSNKMVYMKQVINQRQILIGIQRKIIELLKKRHLSLRSDKAATDDLLLLDSLNDETLSDNRA